MIKCPHDKHRFDDGLPEEGDILELEDGSVWKLTCCGWTFRYWKNIKD